MDVQIKECEGFLLRGPVASDRVGCEEAEQRLTALKHMQQFTPPPPVDTEEELRQLRATIAQMKGQVEGAATVEGQAPKRICRREDFVPMCVEVQEWIAGRQADLNEALSVGRPDKIARISNIMCQAAQQWQQEVASGLLPSMVSNSVS